MEERLLEALLPVMTGRPFTASQMRGLIDNLRHAEQLHVRMIPLDKTDMVLSSKTTGPR